jgi:hypothetical protein
MNIRHRTFGPATIAVAALVIAVALPLIAHATHLRRLAANFTAFDGLEVSTDCGIAATSACPSAPLTIYNKTVTVPLGNNVIYVTLSATGDSHGGAAVLLRCLVDGSACGGTTFAGGAGWIRLQKTPDAYSDNCNDGGGGGGDCHDNSITYTWCKSVGTGTRTVKLQLASSDEFDRVFMEGVSVYVDVNSIAGSSSKCAEYETPDPMNAVD